MSDGAANSTNPASELTGINETPTNVAANSNVVDQSQTQQTVGVKRGREVSKVWEHFTVVQGTSGKTRRATCNYCKSSYACGSTNIGTTNLWSHLDGRCHKYNYTVVRDRNQKKLIFKPKQDVVVDGFIGGSLKAIGYTAEACRKALTTMIIIDEMPFRVVECAGFLNYSQVLQPLFKVPSRVTVARDCMKLYFEEKTKLREIIKGQRICLTTYTWISIQNINYMCLTAHWIDDDWKLNKRIINFYQVASHKGEVLGKVVENCLLDWGIDRILTLTIDNASSNDGVIKHSKGVGREWKDVIFEHEFLHVRCCAHIVNLIVTEGLKEVDESIIRIRNAIRYVRSSPSRLLSFKKFAEKLKISTKSLVCLDIPTRWNSTYKMLESAGKFEKVFDRLKKEDAKFVKYFEGEKISGPPTSLDWKNSRVFIKFLKMFYMVTLRFSGSLFVTCNNFFHELVNMQSKIVQLSRANDHLLSGMAAGMLVKFDKYWGKFDKVNFLLYVAVVLDPRYKLRYVKFCFGQVYDQATASDLTNKVRATLVRLFEHFSARMTISDEGNGSGSGLNTTQVEEISESLDEEHNDLASRFKMHLMEEDNVDNKDEVERYLLDGCEEINDQKFNLLDWWKANGYKYRILAMIAREVLAVPVSTVASESAFSTGGRILDPFRSSLAPTMVEALLCCQNWLRCSIEQIDLHDALENIENYNEIESEIASKVTLDLDVDEDLEADEEGVELLDRG